MNIRGYLRDKYLYLLALAACVAVVAVFLAAFSIPPHAVIFVVVLISAVFIFLLVREYTLRKQYYDNIVEMFEKLDKKYLISELIDEGDFVDSRIFYDMLRRANKSMSDEVADIKLKTREYAEYLETWVHEIKTPIASARLTIENNRGSVAKSIGGDIDRIEGYVQNVLFYTRSSFVEKDYMIKELSLDALVKRALKENSRMLIENNTAVSMDGLDINVFTDEKWICFILGQIITNSVKYSRGDNPRLCFYGRDIGQSVVLDISDDGIGIPAADLPRIFEKGFTGENGRKYAKSTGMGLFFTGRRHFPTACNLTKL